MRQQHSTRRHTRIQADATTHTERTIQSMHTNDNTNFTPSGNRRHRHHGAAATPTIVIRLAGSQGHQRQRLIVTLDNQGGRHQDDRGFDHEFRAGGPHRHRRDEQSDGFHAEGSRRHGEHEINRESRESRESRDDDSHRQTVGVRFNQNESHYGRRAFAPEFRGESLHLHRERPSIEGFRAEGQRRHRGGCSCVSRDERPRGEGQINRDRGMRGDPGRSECGASTGPDRGRGSGRRDW